MAHANYIWIGKPPTGEHGGQDTLGPKTMRERMPDQGITFWCLKSQQAHYQEELDGLNIEVLAVEDAIPPEDHAVLEFIQLCLRRAKFLEARLEEAIAAGDEELQQALKKDIAREYISIKDIMMYYLQTAHQLAEHSDDACQYYLDTNISLRPDFEKPLLDNIDTFSVPFHVRHYDPWLMISQKTDVSDARRRFDTMFEQYSEDVYKRFFLHEPNDGQMNRQNDGTRMWLSIAYVDNCHDAQKLIMQQESNEHVYLDIGLQKRYMNTHKKSKQCDATPLVTRIAKGTSSIHELKHLLHESTFKPSDSYTITVLNEQLLNVDLKVNIFLDLTRCTENKSQELDALMDALDDLSILFFNPIDISCDQTPFELYIDRHINKISENELELLLNKCFDSHPELKLRCFKLIERLIPGEKVANTTDLIHTLTHQKLANGIILYTFQSIIPEGEHRNIPDFVAAIEGLIRSLPESTSAVTSVFFAASNTTTSPPVTPEDEHDKGPAKS